MEEIDDLEIAVADYVDWCNHRRLHGEIGHVPPVQAESNFYSNLPAVRDGTGLNELLTNSGLGSEPAPGPAGVHT